jgi:hypothetical protein
MRAIEQAGDVAASIIANADDLSTTAVDQYWASVRRCLVEIFKTEGRDAQAAVDKLVARLNAELSGQDRLFIYHSSPLEIAASLAGADSRPLSIEEHERYSRMLSDQFDNIPKSRDFDRVISDNI